MSSDQTLKPDQSKVFRLPGAVVAWGAWVIFAAANLIDLAIQGRSHTAAEIAAALAVITGLVYACALRPRVVADPGGITVMNPLRDHRVPWGSVTAVDLAESVRVHFTPEAGATREKVIHSWALHARRPNRLKTDLLRQGGRRRLPLSSVESYGRPASAAAAGPGRRSPPWWRPPSRWRSSSPCSARTHRGAPRRGCDGAHPLQSRPSDASPPWGHATPIVVGGSSESGWRGSRSSGRNR